MSSSPPSTRRALRASRSAEITGVVMPGALPLGRVGETSAVRDGTTPSPPRAASGQPAVARGRDDELVREGASTLPGEVFDGARDLRLIGGLVLRAPGDHRRRLGRVD